MTLSICNNLYLTTNLLMSQDLQQSILKLITQQEDIVLSGDQSEALRLFVDFLQSPESNSTFMLTGSAGTGKTFLINILSQYLRKSGYKVILLAPTGRAAKVITKRTKRLAYTIHHHIYNPVEGSLGGGLIFDLKRNKEQARTVYIVDEASMIGDQKEEGTRSLLQDLLRFVFGEDDQRKLILVGDPVQLPPIGLDVSPALNADALEHKYRLTMWHAHLNEVKRQMEDSGVLGNAVLIRDAYNDSLAEVELQPRRDVQIMENAYDALETYLGYYRDGEPERVVFIGYSNARVTKINQAIRRQLHYTEEPLIEGDLLMVVKNNYAHGDAQRMPFIANGDVGMVRRVYDAEQQYGLRWQDVEMEFQDAQGEPLLVNCKIVLDLLDSKLPNLPDEVIRKVADERRALYFDLPKTQFAEQMRTDPYVNALQVKYGYAITGHKSQGGQWQNAIIAFEPDYGQNPTNYLRWTYTAFTRAEERVFLLDCPFVPKD